MTPREEDGGGGPKAAVPHTKNMKRALTGHVVTRWSGKLRNPPNTPENTSNGL